MIALAILYNVVLCYHGFAEQPLTFRSRLEDFQAQVQHLQELGYTFKKPSEAAQQLGNLSCIACIIFDDALDSITPALDWLVEHHIPFGITVIARRLRKLDPESGFMSWETLKYYLQTGLCELVNHTYNLHHLTLRMGESGIDGAPILEGPSWIPDGDFVYISADDSRWYWDLTFVDDYAWGFPIFGTDPNTQETIRSTLRFKAKKSVTVNEIIVWASLHYPSSSGYDAHVRITINGTIVKDGIISPRAYETRLQWQEREFLRIPLDTPVDIISGETVEITWETLNVGNGAFQIYVIPDVSGNYELITTCTNRDYPPNVVWPARPAIILTSGSGRVATDAEYEQYVRQDFEAFYDSLRKYLGEWSVERLFDPLKTDLYTLAIAGTYSDGSLVDTYVRVRVSRTVTIEALKIKYAGQLGERYAAVVEVSIGQRTGVGEYTNPTVIATFTPNWHLWHWQTINITPITLYEGVDYYLRFRTLNQSPFGQGVLQLYLDQQRPPEPKWDVVGYDLQGNPIYGWILPDPSEYNHEDWFVVTEPEGTDVYPDGVYVDYNSDWQWLIEFPYDGPGKAFIELWAVSEEASPPPVLTMAHPFGAYYEIGTGGTYTPPNPQLINPALQRILNDFGIQAGWTITPTRFRDGLLEPTLRVDQYTLPRLLIYGDVPLDTILNNLDAYIGITWKQTFQNDVMWQVAVEYDQYYNATVRLSKVDLACFDAYFFRIPNSIVKGPINTSDREILRQQGKKQLIIFSNYDDTIDEPNPEIARHVLENPDVFIDEIDKIVMTEEWDGANVNLEWVPPDLREAANRFVQLLAERLIPKKKLIMINCPAITGTNYDDPNWTGWCDYATLVKYVHLLKIMTYTESGEFGPPAPHAPTDFFNAVYEYVKKTIPPRFRARVLVGANAFGHLWTDKDVEYVDFHEALLNAILHGAAIEEKDGEAHWQASNYESYFGSPLTISRAYDIALTQGFAGVAVWKADDGDVLQHYPKALGIRRAKLNWHIKNI